MRDAAYMPTLNAAEALQMNLIFYKVVKPNTSKQADSFVDRSTEELKDEIDNTLSSIMLAQRANLDNYSAAHSLLNIFRKIPR